MNIVTTFFGSKGSLRNHSSFYLIANIFSKGFLLISMPILTRMLSPSDFGIITIFDSIYFTMTILFSFAVEESIKRFYFEKRRDFSYAAGSMFIAASLLSMVFLAIILLFHDWLSNLFAVPAVVILFAGVLSFLAVPKGILMQLLNAQQESKKYSLLATIASFLNLSFTILFIYLLKDNKYEGRVYGQMVPAILFFVLAQIYIFRKFKFTIRRRYLKYFFSYSLPLIPYRLSGLLLTYVDSMIIGKIVGMKETGLYSIAYRIGMGVLILHTSISMAMEPKIMLLMNNYQENVKKINGYIENAAKSLFFFGFVISVFAKYILRVLVPEEYYDAINIVPIIILSYCFLFIYEQFTRINRFYKKTIINTTAMVISIIVNIILNIWLIPIFGYKIAAFTTLISMIVLLGTLWYHTRFYLQITSIVNVQRLIMYILLPVSLFYGLTLFITFNNLILDISVKLFFVFSLFVVMFRKSVKNFL